ncbi:TetR/AcrR family transcriptional regulator [Hwanghaeella grinnelliae]|uniref:TetR/AcrR family transcriptional regulator n=1 Tax=Hwanghaeella grinnelliae TaxID=2500179 RepID=A0A3S2WBX6_9PROT|nr:TetR/AcrR family transcriptional regulator [Hwanghaeella grinnelliae]RVU38902.1 TetR/AcrR family transcriptional regulator [Hwanghaeella grinnelliae]
MPEKSTGSKIIGAAEELFYEHGLRSVSVDMIAERAGVTKRTLYYHFDSKDDLIEAYLQARDNPTIERYRTWLGAADRPMPDRIRHLFSCLAEYAGQPNWRGCGFTRAAIELIDMPGHPAVIMAADHKKRFEAWLARAFEEAGTAGPALLGQQVVTLIEGAIAQILVHRDVSYARVAGQAAALLVAAASTGDIATGEATTRHGTARQKEAV